MQFNYKLYTEQKYDNPVKQILCGRGLPEDQVDIWLKADIDNINNWQALGEEDMRKGAWLLNYNLQKDTKILIIVDSDADGYTSAAIIANYINAIPHQCEVDFFMHTDKQHGLIDAMGTISTDYGLIICPDGASNDYEQHEQLNKMGIDVLILDHHVAPYKSPFENVITINNQLCDYPNKDLSGAGIAWQFCRAYDEIYNYHHANNFIDLAALGNLSDMENYLSLETRALINWGLQFIINPFFSYMVKQNEYSINKMGGINYFSIAFYVTPFINAVVRSGTMEEKNEVFKSMLTYEAYKRVSSGKRGHIGELVPRVEEAVRMAVNVKARQTKAQDAAMQWCEQYVNEHDLIRQPILLILCEPGIIDPNIAGLCANKLQAKMQRPTLILTKTYDAETDRYIYRGSGRNYSMSEITDFRQVCENTNEVEYATGHAGAFGLGLDKNKIDNFLEKIKQQYSSVSFKPLYYVDYIWHLPEISNSTILNIADMQDFWGTGIPESYICLEKLALREDQIELLSKDKNPTLKITLDNGVSLIKFKSSELEYNVFKDSTTQPDRNITIIGKPNKNEWGGSVIPQIIIETYFWVQEWRF